MKSPRVLTGSTTCAEPGGCPIAIVPVVGKRGPRFCAAHTPDLYGPQRAVDVEPAPLRGRVTATDIDDAEATP